MDIEFDIECLQYMALESTVLCDPENYGLPDEKKYPMPDKKHVLLAIKFFNSTEDPEKQKILAANLNNRIKDFNMESEVNVGDKNNFRKYWNPATDLKDEISKSYDGNEAVITNVSPIVPYQQPALKKAESIDDPLLMRFPIKKKRKFPEIIATESNISLSKSNDINSMSTPEKLSKWMKKNIQYDHNDKTWRLRSTNQLISELKGDCHDQSNFEFDWFKSHGFRCIRLFMIEFNSKNGKKWWKQQCGSTHTILAYNKSKQWFWFENAWVNKAGIHGPYETINDLVNDICNEWTVNGSYDTLFVTELGNVMPRMTLDEYILANVPNSKTKYVFYKKLNKVQR